MKTIIDAAVEATENIVFFWVLVFLIAALFAAIGVPIWLWFRLFDHGTSWPWMVAYSIGVIWWYAFLVALFGRIEG